MNSPVMQGLTVQAPSYVKNAKLIAWVADMAALCKPEHIHWCDGSDEEYDRLCQQLVDAGTFKQARPGQAPQLLPRLVRPERRGARRRPHLHLLATRRKTPAPPTTGWRPAEMRATLQPLFDGCMRGRTMYVVPFSHGPAGLAHRAHRHRAVRQPVRRRQHEDHDPHGPRRVRRAGRRRRVRALRAHRRRAARSRARRT